MAINFLSGIDVDNGVLYTDTANDRVGIGTTSPTALLTLESSSTSPYPGIDIKSTSFYPGGEIRFLNSSGSEVSVIESYNNPGRQDITVRYTGSTSGGKVELQDNAAILGAGTSGIQSYAQVGTVDFRVNTNFSTRMYINSLGNVGIGTTSPQEKLHVQNYTTGESHQAMFKGGAVTVGDYSYISLNNGYSTEYNKEVRLAAVSEQSNSNKTGFAVLTSPDANGASGHERLRVTADGNVGIGTMTPSATLDVSGSMLVNDDVRIIGNYPSIHLKTDNPFKHDSTLNGIYVPYHFCVEMNQDNDGIGSDSEVNFTNTNFKNAVIKEMQKVVNIAGFHTNEEN